MQHMITYFSLHCSTFFPGILSDVLKYITMESSNILIGNDEHKHKVIECFNLLRGLASRNEEVKMK